MRRLVLNRFWLPPLLREQPTLLALLNFTAPPLLWGLLCGVLAGVSRVAFIAGLVLSFSGAFGAGRQHRGAAAGALRGAGAGALFGAAILLGRALAGGGYLLFDLPILQVAFTAAVAASLGALGGSTRSREGTASARRLAPSDLPGPVAPGD